VGVLVHCLVEGFYLLYKNNSDVCLSVVTNRAEQVQGRAARAYTCPLDLLAVVFFQCKLQTCIQIKTYIIKKLEKKIPKMKKPNKE